MYAARPKGRKKVARYVTRTAGMTSEKTAVMAQNAPVTAMKMPNKRKLRPVNLGFDLLKTAGWMSGEARR